jgi:hypothetical protein
MTGEIAVMFEDDRTLGVVFDQPVIGGIDFSKTAVSACGYFVPLSSVKAEQDYRDEVETVAVEALFASATANAPCVVLIRDVEGRFCIFCFVYLFFLKGVVLASMSRYRKFRECLVQIHSFVFENI